MNRTSRHPTKILVSSNDYEAPHPHAVNLVSSVTIINVNIFSSSNITLHNLQHHVFFSSPDFPANITPQPLLDLMLSAKVYLNTSFCLVLHNTLWPVHRINHQINFIFTTPHASLARASQPIPSPHLVPPPQFHFFQSHNNIIYVTAHHTRNLHSFHIQSSNAVTTFESSPYPQQYHLQVHSAISLR